MHNVNHPEILDLYHGVDDWYDNWKWLISESKIHLDDAFEQQGEATSDYYLGFESAALEHVIWCLDDLYRSIWDVMGRHDGAYFGDYLTDGMYLMGALAVTTWENIITAWTDAPKLGRLWTVLTIDELRRESWNEEFISFTIAPPES